MQHVAEISCKNGAEGEYSEEKGEFRREKCNMLQKSLLKMALRLNAGRKKAIYRREKCNMLQKSLVETVLRVNIRKEKASLEEKSATCCKNLF